MPERSLCGETAPGKENAVSFLLRFEHLRALTRGAVHTFVNPVCLALCAAIVACASDDDGGSDEETDGTAEERTFDEQVMAGGELYGTHCAHCHGDAGQGTEDAPAVVGEGALPLEPPAERMVRESEFRTALDVFTFASENMPGDDPGSLSDQEMVDILAFALFANGVTLEEPLDFDNAADVVIN